MPLLIGFAAAFVMMPLAHRLGLTTGLVDRPTDPLKIHRGPVPILGGVAVTAAALLGTGVTAWPSVAVLTATGLALFGGLADDVRPVPPWARFLLHAASGLILVAGGARIEALGSLGTLGAVFLVVACVNAVNLVDGQDGLAGGLGAIAALGLAGVAALHGASTGESLGLALGGSLLAFLLWNRPPARIFLGNGGAYAVGTLLAAVTLDVVAEGGWQAVLAAGVSLGVLAFELGFTVARRLGSRSALTAGDRSHSYDLLAARLGGRTRSTLVFWALGTVMAALGLLVSRAPLPLGMAIASGGLAAALAAAATLWGRVHRTVK